MVIVPICQDREKRKRRGENLAYHEMEGFKLHGCDYFRSRQK